MINNDEQKIFTDVPKSALKIGNDAAYKYFCLE